MSLSLLGDVLIFYFCLGLIALWLVCKILFGYDLLAPCENNNTCSVAAVQKYEASKGRIATCEQLSKADGRFCGE